MTTPAAERLDELARRVRRLQPSARDPEQYHVDKSAIEHELRSVARELRRAERCQYATRPRGSVDTDGWHHLFHTRSGENE